MILDPLPTGVTAVADVLLYPDEARSQTPTTAPVTLVGGQWTVDTSAVPEGRWWPTVQAVKGAEEFVYNTAFVDLPDYPDLLVSPQDLAERLGMDPAALTPAQHRTLAEAIADAQDDVEVYLGQPITPRVFVQHNCWPYGDGWDLTEQGDTEVIEVLSVAPEFYPTTTDPTGYFTVTFRAGLDARNDRNLRPIRRFVIAHAANSASVLTIWRDVAKVKGAIRSLSAEGQGVSFDVATPLGTAGSKPGDLAPGSLPTLSTLDFWRVAGRRVYQGPTRYGALDGLV